MLGSSTELVVKAILKLNLPQSMIRTRKKQREMLDLIKWKPIPILMIFFALLSAIGVNETINLVTFIYSVIGVWLLFFALGSISLLCGALFLKSKKSLTASGLLILGQYILVRVGGMVEEAKYVKYFSLFNYLNAGTIVNSGTIPIVELLVVIIVGITALVGALYIFQKRELAF